ncbi:hypothetical protein E2C01_088407 [Portunus trituberculatus]|uniref:Uncharacterized protein n=1 Tax=Portunus trituberculatus TaxID=210409 RepID=A0A5B7JFW6_PORTR|nr:hypothetical protein [Portunus trituberculatus]
MKHVNILYDEAQMHIINDHSCRTCEVKEHSFRCRQRSEGYNEDKLSIKKLRLYSSYQASISRLPTQPITECRDASGRGGSGRWDEFCEGRVKAGGGGWEGSRREL